MDDIEITSRFLTKLHAGSGVAASQIDEIDSMIVSERNALDQMIASLKEQVTEAHHRQFELYHEMAENHAQWMAQIDEAASAWDEFSYFMAAGNDELARKAKTRARFAEKMGHALSESYTDITDTLTALNAQLETVNASKKVLTPQQTYSAPADKNDDESIPFGPTSGTVAQESGYKTRQDLMQDHAWDLMTAGQNGKEVFGVWCQMKRFDTEEEAKAESYHMTTQEAMDLITSLKECWGGEEGDEHAAFYAWLDDGFQADKDLSWLTDLFYTLFRYTI